MSRPLTLSIGVVLQWLAALFAAVAGFDLIAASFSMSREGVPHQIEQALVTAGITDVAGGLVVLGVFIAGIGIVALALIRILVGAYVWQGRSWARTVLAVLIVMSLIGGVAYLFQGYILRALFTVPIDVVTLFLIFDSRSSAFIKARTDARAEVQSAAV